MKPSNQFFFFVVSISLCFPFFLHSGEKSAQTDSPVASRNGEFGEVGKCGAPVKGADLITKRATPSAEEESIQLLIEALSPTQKKDLLRLLNTGTPEELASIKGIARSRAKTIAAARPFHNLEEIMLLRGFGLSLAANILQHEISDS